MDIITVIMFERERLKGRIMAPFEPLPDGERLESELEIHAQLRVLKRVENAVLKKQPA